MACGVSLNNAVHASLLW